MKKIRTKTEQLVNRTLKYVESALTDAKQHEMISIEDPHQTAKRVYSLVLGTLLYARIRNSLAALDDLEASIMDIIGAKAPVA